MGVWLMALSSIRLGTILFRSRRKRKSGSEFQRILDNHGRGPLAVSYPLAQLGKARATKDKREYEKFFENGGKMRMRI